MNFSTRDNIHAKVLWNNLKAVCRGRHCVFTLNTYRLSFSWLLWSLVTDGIEEKVHLTLLPGACPITSLLSIANSRCKIVTATRQALCRVWKGTFRTVLKCKEHSGSCCCPPPTYLKACVCIQTLDLSEFREIKTLEIWPHSGSIQMSKKGSSRQVLRCTHDQY